MGDIARCSMGKAGEFYNEDLLYRLFGINAELLIDHAWGWEPCTIADIKAYKPSTNSVCSGQVLQEPYSFEKARLVVREMADLLALDLVEKGLVADQIVMTVGYDILNLKDPGRAESYRGAVTTDRYGREIPKHAHGSVQLRFHMASAREFTRAAMELYDRVVDPGLLVRRINLTANHVVREEDAVPDPGFRQLDLFTDGQTELIRQEQDKAALEREMRMQRAMVEIRKKYGKNAILKGMNLEEGATAVERNGRIGGHKA